MAIVIREADLGTELDAMQAIYDANRLDPSAPERFRWLYLDNPDGPATAWVAEDDRTGMLAGFTAAFPRRVQVVGGEPPVLGWNCGDFSIHKRYRTMGVAVKLRRAAKDLVDTGRVPFLYAHPNDRMLAVHVQAGHRRMGTMRRFAKVLSVGSGRIASLSQQVLRVSGRDVFGRRGHRGEWITDTVKADLDEIFRTVAPRLGTMLVRDATYLQWRFLQFPLARIELLVVRRAGRPVAYVAVVVGPAMALVKDWLALDDQAFDGAWTILLDELRGRGVSRVSVTALETHPDLRRLRRFGFFERDETASAVVTYTLAGSSFARVLDARAWYMTVGDRDV